jgi:hypothetical protein
MTTTSSPPDAAASAVTAGRVVAPWWRGARWWIGLTGFVFVGAIVVAVSSPAPGYPLDPNSASKDGSKALAQLLNAHGTAVHRVDQLADVRPGPVVVPFPNAFAPDQLLGLMHSGHRLVLIAPADVTAIDPRLAATGLFDTNAMTVAPGCTEVGAAVAGSVRFPTGTQSYAGRANCYGGRAVLADDLVVLGSSGLLQNDHLAGLGVAALAMNALSTNSTGATAPSVTWLMPGPDAAGPGQPSVWSLFPDWSHLAFRWLILVGGLLVLWRGRRMGPPVLEPLPVVVRAAEIVEGHGRLYQRAKALDRAAAALRSAALVRLASRLSLGRGAGVPDVRMAVQRSTGQPAAEVASLLAGAVPTDDSALVRLAVELDRLEASVVERGLPTTPIRPEEGRSS